MMICVVPVTIDSVSGDDILIMLGDFNARVGAGSSEMERSQWDGVRAQRAVGKTNEAGTSLLTFCVLNRLTIMNIWFEKKEMYKYTWQHPDSKKWHCIDYILMRNTQRKFCRDVSVIRKADCWTDHKLLRAKIGL